METKKSKYHALAIINIAVLALLLLLSPCKVRYSLQSLLDLPTTEVSNKSVTTISQSGCAVSTTIDMAAQEVKTPKQKLLPIATIAHFTTQNIVSNEQQPNIRVAETKDLKTQVPYYILFQSFKYHL